MLDAAMKIDVESLEACKRRLSVEAPLDVVQQAWERAYSRVQRQARLPGFRKGHVPRSLVKLHFADDVRREVAEHLIPDLYRQAVREAQLEPVDEPDLSDVRLEEDAPLTFKAVVEIRPTIALGDYKGLDVQHAPTPVTEEDVGAALEQMRAHHAELRSVERAAGPGDVAIVDYTLTPEGLPASSESGYAFQIGEGTVLPEIDQAVVGLSAGEERTVGVRFAADHRREELRDKPGQAQVKLVEVKEKVLPPLDDDFAKLMGNFDTLEAVRTELRSQIEAGRAREDRLALEGKLVDAALARHEFPVPEALVLRQVQHQVEHARERVRRQGVDPDRLPWDYQKLVADLRPGAERAVRRALLLEAIAAAESIAPSEADLESEIEKLAAASRRPAPALRRMMEKGGDLEGLRSGLREQQTLDLLLRHATVHPPGTPER
jgi:trigger factor